MPQCRASVGESADDGDDDVLESRVLDRPPEERQGVHAPGPRVDDLRVVVLPAGLVLLGSVVVVDGEQHGAGGARGRAEVDRGLPAVRADLQQRPDGAGREAGRMQRHALGVGHEALRRPRDRQLPLVHRKVVSRDMRATRALTVVVPFATAAILLSACSSGSTAAESSAPAASAPAASAAASPAASGAPSAELTAWAGQVCDATAALKDSVSGIATAITSGGSDVAASVSSQFSVITTSATTLVDTVTAIPADGSSPEADAVKASADASKAAVDKLGTSITDLTNASGIGAVTAVAGVASAAKDALSALGATSDTISTAMQSGKGTIAQAFAANPSCVALQQ